MTIIALRTGIIQVLVQINNTQINRIFSRYPKYLFSEHLPPNHCIWIFFWSLRGLKGIPETLLYFYPSFSPTRISLDLLIIIIIILLLGKWLNTNLTLHEQGVGVEDGVVLKKKFFVSDANVDTNNPAQVHFVYIQVMISLNFRQNWKTGVKTGLASKGD